MRRYLPSTELGRGLLLGLVLVWAGISITFAPLNLPGPGLGLAIPGAIIVVLVLLTPSTEANE